MWFKPLLGLTLLSALAFGQDDESLPGPGEPALDYTEGYFSTPNGNTAAFQEGSTMNVSWATEFETSNLYLIVGWNFDTPVQLTTNTAKTWYEWEVTPDSNNETEIYAFRIVDASGSTEAQQGGGFLSAAFNIGLDKSRTTSLTSTMATITTPASAPTESGAEAALTTDDANQATATAAPVESGLSEGGKIGLGVGIGVGVLGIAALTAGIRLWRRSKEGGGKSMGSPAPESYEPYSGSPQTYDGTPRTYAANPSAYKENSQAYAGYYKPNAGPAEMESISRSTELDAHQGHAVTPQSYTDNAPRQPPTELQG